MQVADRFHLVLNLSAAIERVLEERRKELVVPPAEPPIEPSSRQQAEPKPTLQQKNQQQRRQRRLERYQRVVELFGPGRSKQAISRELNLAYKTVRRWLRAGSSRNANLPVAADSTWQHSASPYGSDGMQGATTEHNSIGKSELGDTRALVKWSLTSSRRGARTAIRPHARRHRTSIQTVPPS